MNKNKSFFKKKYWYNLYAFISYGAFLLLKISKNFLKWVYIGMGEVFFLETQKNCPKAQQNTLLVSTFILPYSCGVMWINKILLTISEL